MATDANVENFIDSAKCQKSNEKALDVELTPEKRPVTINCGSVDSPMLADPTTQYCEPGDAESGTCKGKNYVDVLPKFEASWVKHDSQKHSVTPTIPEDGFPSKDEKIRLGCAPRENAKDTVSATSPDQVGAAATNCDIIVTITAASSASAESTLKAAVVASVALAGLVAGSL
ncbi:SAG-related sequence protein SRS19F [Toxoplasma gondii VAND]|uniref:SAG-related sequence protein SRS19F n=1 Tax=Toxoplasma gondii VAND TaxID=933077 RepID=A0A086PHG1_TOXGO|nr:SAG-related sequence protein SRS19F [Toxoplasma gondii VAND]